MKTGRLFFVTEEDVAELTVNLVDGLSGNVTEPVQEVETDSLGHYGFFLCVRWARALDLGHALLKKTCFFSTQRAH